MISPFLASILTQAPIERLNTPLARRTSSCSTRGGPYPYGIGGVFLQRGRPVVDGAIYVEIANRRAHVAMGYLPGPVGANPRMVSLDINMVEVSGELDGIAWNLSPKIAETVVNVVQSSYDLWFNEAGDAFVSFQNEEDAILFKLALDA